MGHLNITYVFVSFFAIISIWKIKREDRATSHSLYFDKNVNYKQFFDFGTTWEPVVDVMDLRSFKKCFWVNIVVDFESSPKFFYESL